MTRRIARLVFVLMLCSSVGYASTQGSTSFSSSWFRFNPVYTRTPDQFNPKTVKENPGIEKTVGTSAGGPAASSGGGCGPETCLLAAMAFEEILCAELSNTAHKENATSSDVQKVYDDAMKQWGNECGKFEDVTGLIKMGGDTWNNTNSYNASANNNPSPNDQLQYCLKFNIGFSNTPNCGDGIVEKGEDCDGGPNNGKPNSYCDSTCHYPKSDSSTPSSGSDTTTCPKLDCSQCPKTSCVPGGGGILGK